ncbi:DNA polymerase III subunit epsilon [Bifidobacterium sp. SMB2]|uniref:DNA polymerase III subunit epsilon n=1 Tax=Bifidobacterium saimiriisciurei TaxID=2661627 RepID=A0ABX0C7Q3_9BIFI|nr:MULTISPECIES: exonuclease domain-containing protein [Bifidobacterium]NEG95759.1 DNA polymerase III subunit epsilon [Bifidobacterium sp. SMB2]NEH11186.1 DNA polymerase III subunit epsilon [Bifidobacterium saimiriisciurei]
MTELLQALDSIAAQSEDTTLADTRILGFDTETTGTRAGSDAICSATLVLRDPALGHDGDVVDEWLMNPHRPVSPGASRVNGFTDEFLQANGGEPVELLEAIASVIAEAQNRRIPLLAYNAPFDVHMLEGDLARWDLKPLHERLNDDLLVIDPLVIDRKVSHRKGKRTLTDTTFYYGVEPHGDFHDATADTIAAVDLVAPIARLHPDAAALRLDELMDWQRTAHAEWKESFNRWLEARGRRPIREGWFGKDQD